jgi:hypothetical protein
VKEQARRGSAARCAVMLRLTGKGLKISSQRREAQPRGVKDIKAPSGKAEPFRTSGGKAARKSLMLEMPYTRKDHCQPMLIRGRDYFVIPH